MARCRPAGPGGRGWARPDPAPCRRGIRGVRPSGPLRERNRVEPLVRPAGTGALAYHLNVVAPRERWAEIQGILTEAIVLNDIGESLYLLCRAPDLGTHARRIAQLEALDGVERADVVLNRSFALATERLHGWIAEELARWEAARR